MTGQLLLGAPGLAGLPGHPRIATCYGKLRIEDVKLQILMSEPGVTEAVDAAGDMVNMSPDLALSLSIVPLLAAALVTPGYVILFMISRFTTGRPAFASSLAVSSVYYVAVWSILGWGSALDVATRLRNLEIGWPALLVVVVVPLVIGVFVGIGVQQGWIYRLLRRLNLEPVHGIPSAWDWKFMRAESRWITVHLKNGEIIVALYDENCFVSTDSTERDLYLSNVYTWESENDAPVRENRVDGLLLKGDSIDRIEFHPLPDKRASSTSGKPVA